MVSRIEIRDCIAEEVATESGRIPPTKVPICVWYKLFCADGLFYKRNRPNKQPVTEAKVIEVGARQLSMHACEINRAQKLFNNVTYGCRLGFLLFV